MPMRSYKLSTEEIAMLDDIAADWSARNPTRPLTKSDAIRLLIRDRHAQIRPKKSRESRPRVLTS